MSLLLTVVSLGCASTAPPETPPPPPPEPAPTISESAREAQANEAAARKARIAALREENEDLRRSLEESQARLAVLEERTAELEEHNAALETELANAVEEVLRSKASMTGVQNRALAVSRISEVRVAVQGLADTTDEEVRRRMDRATDFLRRADDALADGNYGGASFLAERASELVRQARTVAELRSSTVGAGALPIVPPRDLEVISTANLRSGPGVENERIGAASVGEHLRALARAGQWFHVETESGLRAWIHSSLVE